MMWGIRWHRYGHGIAFSCVSQLLVMWRWASRTSHLARTWAAPYLCLFKREFPADPIYLFEPGQARL